MKMPQTPPDTTPFCVIGAVQYEMLETREKSYQIASWFHRHCSHAEEDPEVERKMLLKTRPNGYHEDGDKIYVLSRIPK